MAFVARRNTEGKLVDCQVISGRLRSNSMSMSDVSDDDADSSTVHGYSNRSYVSPTVRYVATKEEEDELESCYTYDSTHGHGTVRDHDHAGNYSEHYESGDEQDVQPEAGGQYLSDANSDEEIEKSEDNVDEQTMITPNRYAAHRELSEVCSVDALSLSSVDGDTICSPNDKHKMHFDDNLSMASYDVATICVEAKPQQDDGLSMSSFDVATICHPELEANLISDDNISLGTVNSATVCRPAKAGDPGVALDNMSTNTFDCQSQMTNRTYNVKATAVRRDDCSSASTCSWTDMYGGALKQSESRSNIVPSLSLNLSTTSSSGSSTYFRTFDDKKERHGQAAYQEWVKRKERQQQEKLQAAKEKREKKVAETAMRQRLAKERYQEWCRQKELQQKKSSTSSIKSATSSISYSSSSSGSSVGNSTNNQARLQRKETPEARQKRIQEWDRSKKQQQQRERERIRQKQLSKERLDAQRKQKSDGAWQNWMKSVGKRGKPVPLNQGFDTLRGTISNIYINPNQWVSNIDPHDTRGN